MLAGSRAIQREGAGRLPGRRGWGAAHFDQGFTLIWPFFCLFEMEEKGGIAINFTWASPSLGTSLVSSNIIMR